ncbi:hypothetical protein BT69DRAFT_796519 [Atractiella rhizophila]|nr:hypothetical protein BT69DRAFT_796519 [Atractiella rhizophila]
MWQEDTKFSTIKRDSQSIANSRREAPLPPIPKDLEPLPPISIEIPSSAANEKPSGNFTANFSGSSSIPKSTGSRHSSAELSLLSQQLAQFDSNISNAWDFNTSASPLSSAKSGNDESVAFPNSPTGEDAGIAPTPVPAATNGASAPAATNGLKRTTSISHPKVQIPRYVRQSFSSRPTDLPGSPTAATSTTTSSRPTSPTNIIPSITATQFTVESPIEEKPVRALLVPKVALRRSDTLPKYPPEPEKLKEAETVDRDVDSLPLNPKVWTPTHVGIYLTHVLKLVPKPLVEDVRAYVTTSSMGGRTFLRMKESDLRELGINQNWVRIISSAREKLRREVLAGKIWGVEEEEVLPESHGEGMKSGTNLGVPEAKEMWQKSWRRTKGSKSRGRVKGMAQEFENVMPEDRPDSPSSLSFARAEEARKAISQGWKDRRRRKKKAPATPSDVPALTDDSNVTHPQHVKSDSISSSSEISFEDDQGTRSVIRKRNDSVSSFDSECLGT